MRELGKNAIGKKKKKKKKQRMKLTNTSVSRSQADEIQLTRSPLHTDT